MPNWVHHHLTITGPAEERERFLQECFTASGEGPELDFNKLIPMPEDVKASTKEPGPCFPAHSLWYDWCCDNWGTKWNASGGGITKEGDSLYLSFDTAWAPPEPIFHEIATRYPSLSFAGNILEEMGHF
jgi:hypothetical protein